MKDKNAIRRENVREMIKKEYNGSLKAFAEAVDKSPAQISNITREKEPHNIGDKFARQIESNTGKPSGFLDADPIFKSDIVENSTSESMSKYIFNIADIIALLKDCDRLLLEDDFNVTPDFYEYYNEYRRTQHKFNHRMGMHISEQYDLYIQDMFYDWFLLNFGCDVTPASDIQGPSFGSRNYNIYEYQRIDGSTAYIDLVTPQKIERQRRARYSQIEAYTDHDYAYALKLGTKTNFLFVPNGSSVKEVVEQLISHSTEAVDQEQSNSLIVKISRGRDLLSSDICFIKQHERLYHYILSPAQQNI